MPSLSLSEFIGTASVQTEILGLVEANTVIVVCFRKNSVYNACIFCFKCARKKVFEKSTEMSYLQVVFRYSLFGTEVRFDL